MLLAEFHEIIDSLPDGNLEFAIAIENADGKVTETEIKHMYVGDHIFTVVVKS